jgi:hypothetical protein
MKKDIKKITFELIQIIKKFYVKLTKGKPEKKKSQTSEKEKKRKENISFKNRKKKQSNLRRTF